jgi:hypothetical protein
MVHLHARTTPPVFRRRLIINVGGADAAPIEAFVPVVTRQ